MVNVWQPSLNYVEKYYSITNDENDSSGQKRRFKTWVTDAIFLPNCNKLVIGSTSRDIRFYDCSTNQHFEEFQLFGEKLCSLYKCKVLFVLELIYIPVYVLLSYNNINVD